MHPSSTSNSDDTVGALSADALSRGSRGLRTLAAWLAFGAALFGSAALIRPSLPFPPVPTVREKLAWLSEHGGDYDTLFMGSSRAYNAILPDLFDRLTAEAGIPTHSFNLGVNAMRPPEDDYVLEQALANRRQPLKYGIVMSIPVIVRTDDVNGSRRMAYWHDLKRSGIVFREIAEISDDERRWWKQPWNDVFKPEWRQRMWSVYLGKALGIHVNATLLAGHAANIGRGADWMDEVFGGEAFKPLGARGERLDGYDRHAPDEWISDADWDALSRQIQEYNKHPIVPGFGSNESQRELRRKQHLIEQHGGRMILYLPPDPKTYQLVADPLLGSDIPVLNFGNPSVYPELFQRENRRDVAHLNGPGSEIFTTLLAEEFIKIERDRLKP